MNYAWINEGSTFTQTITSFISKIKLNGEYLMRTAYLGKAINSMNRVYAYLSKSKDGNRQFMAMEFKRLVDLMNRFLEEEKEEEAEENKND